MPKRWCVFIGSKCESATEQVYGLICCYCPQVFFLRGIRKLLQLLYSDNEEVQCVAAGALRNVVYQSSENKMDVKENDGLATICRVLRSNRDVQTRRQLAGQRL